jgi:hypothetical protein
VLEILCERERIGSRLVQAFLYGGRTLLKNAQLIIGIGLVVLALPIFARRSGSSPTAHEGSVVNAAEQTLDPQPEQTTTPRPIPTPSKKRASPRPTAKPQRAVKRHGRPPGGSS